MLRGALGLALRSVACVSTCVDAKTCTARATCAYARTFEPIVMGAGPSGLSDPPRPFVFRAAHLDGSGIAAGSVFHFDLHLFQVREVTVRYFILALAQLAREGLGRERTPVILERVEQLDLAGLRLRDVDAETVDLRPSVLSLDPELRLVERVRVRFITPMELKSGGEIAAHPDFGVLLARVRDRLSTLSALYGASALDLDFGAFAGRAQEIRLVNSQLHRVRVSRVSSRTGQRHALGGFVGEAEYAGQLSEFVPFLTAAQFTGVGRQTAWGKGEILVTCEM